MNISIIKKTLPVVTIVLAVGGISGCDSDNKNNKMSAYTQQKKQQFKQETTLTGQVSNKKGPISQGEIKATDSQGKLIASTTLKDDSHFAITIPAGTELPVILTFYPDEQAEGVEKMISVVVYSSMTQYDINDLTTLIAKKAKEMGGYTHNNMVLAAESTVHVPDANKTTTGFRGDPTKQYGGWH